MILSKEEQLLDPAIRKAIIQEINGSENKARKSEMYKRYQCYKDQTKIYVRNQLLRQFDSNSVNEMEYALSNLGLVRKVIDKLARVYKYGVDRNFADGGEDDSIDTVEKELDVDANMKKTNRFFKLFKNTSLYIRPMPLEDGKLAPKLTPMAPYLYDVIELSGEREKALAYILSDYKPELNEMMGIRPNTDGRVGSVGTQVRASGDNIDQIIADSQGDEHSGQYVWWTNGLHFVTDEHGNIISENTENEIGELPFVNYAEDQDGSFWAIGGDDLTDGGILVNSMITNINHIAITQGYGQLVVTGKDIPKTIKVGPNKAVRLTHEGEDPVPTFEFKSANPPLDQLRALVEMYVALLLTTNNLSTSGVSSNLNGGGSFPSGIAMMLDKAESMEDVEDQRQVFLDNEPHVWRIIGKWLNLLGSRKELPEELSGVSIPEDKEISVQFEKPKAIETEKERLEVLKLKKDMGLVSMLDMIKDEYDLNDEDAEKKLKAILEEKIKRMEMFTNDNKGQQSNIEPNDSADRLGSQPIEGNEAGNRGVPSGADSSDGSGEEESNNG
jgi:hypothetical protein